MLLHSVYIFFRWIAVTVIFILAPLLAQAHENTPAIIDLTVDGTEITLTLQANLEALIAGTAGEHESGGAEDGSVKYLALRDLPAESLFKEFQNFADTFEQSFSLRHNDISVPLTLNSYEIPLVGDTNLARQSKLTYRAILPAANGLLSWHYADRNGDSILRFYSPNSAEYPDPVRADYVPTGERADIDLATVAPQTMGAIVLDYIIAGFDHIIPKGLDHILFVVGLFLLAARLRPLLTQVTMFTLAHTITLALGALGVVKVSGGIVEPLIAASIVFVAVENMFTEKLTPWRPFLIFAFGLLHGLGFASVLGDFGLPARQFIPALISFNIGVEIGQLAVIAICFCAVGFWFRQKDWYHSRIVIPASLAIAIMASYWFVDRVGLL